MDNKISFCIMEKKLEKKNIKISLRHHDIVLEHCDKSGIKIHRFIEKLIDEYFKTVSKNITKRDLYGE